MHLPEGTSFLWNLTLTGQESSPRVKNIRTDLAFLKRAHNSVFKEQRVKIENYLLFVHTGREQKENYMVDVDLCGSTTEGS